MTAYAAALSEHPLATHATGEVVGEVLERIGEAPDVAALFVTAPHAGAVEDIAATVRSVLRPGTLVGATAVSVVGGPREVEEHAAVSLWAARTGPVTPVRIVAEQASDGWMLRGVPEDAATAAALVLLADPFSFPADGFVAQMTEQFPDLVVAGGMASAARGPGGNRLVLDDDVTDHGAVGFLLDAGQMAGTVVSQGCRPIGTPLTVTASDGRLVLELAGQPALDRVQALVASLDPDERALVEQGLHVGRVVDEHKPTFERGDFLIRNVIGAVRDRGAVAIGEDVEVGTTLQFQVRDAASADEDLRHLLAGRTAGGALLFTCNGRGARLFGEPDHDARIVTDAIAGAPLGGMFCAGELGPIGGRSFLHGFTASVVLFAPESSTGAGTPGR